MYSSACVGGKKGKSGRVLGPERALKIGQLTLGKSPAILGVRNHVREAALPSQGSFLAKNKSLYCVRCNLCVQYKKKILFLCSLKMNHSLD
jgi:hypothetical protein